ncbi:hypothetical protein GCM10028798_15710 [Humibacter antri]
MPTPGAVIIPRPRLLKSPDDGAAVHLLRAPTGYGKSVLVRQWLAEMDAGGRQIAVLRVRPGEGDRDGFWIALVDALTDAGIPLPTMANSRTPQSLAARMISTAGHRLTLWIDNFENVTVTGVDEALTDLAAHVPDFRLIVSMRSFRSFAPYALRGVPAITLAPRDLLFTQEEIATLFRSAGVEAADGLAATVNAAIGGWPAMVQMLVDEINRATPHDLTAVIEQVASNWLRDLVPRIPSPELIEFALATSVPESISVETAHLVFPDPSATALLERLVATGLLVPERSGIATEYRWTLTVRKILRAELERRDPARLRTLSERLGHWAAKHGQPAVALAHAIAAENWSLVVAVIDRHWRTLLRNHHDALNSALLATPTEEFFRAPEATPSRAIRSVLLHEDEPSIGADVLPALPEQLAELGANRGAPAAINAALANLLALRTSARWTEAIELGDRVVTVAESARSAQPGAVAELYPSVQFYAGETSLIVGDLRTAVNRFERAFRRSGDSAARHMEADAAAKLALAHAAHGNVPAATSWLRRHEESIETRPIATWLAPFIHASYHAAQAIVATDRLDIVRASAATAFLHENVLPSTLSMYELYAHSLLALSTGSAADVLETLKRVDAAQGTLTRADPFLTLTTLIEADAHLALGHGNEARRLLNGPGQHHALLQTTRARLALLSGETAEALRLAKSSHWALHATRRHRLEMLLIKAVAAHREGENELAVSSLGSAANAATHSGMLRPFTTVPRPDIVALAPDLAPAQRSLIMASLRSGQALYPERIAIVRLTPREQQVLDRINAGQSIQQAAVALQRTYSTVRTQQRSLYRKLQATNRSEAIARARQAGLIPPA